MVGFQEHSVGQQDQSVDSSQIEKRMGEVLSRVQELQERINDAQAQLQAFTSQCQEATLAVHNPLRLASSRLGNNEPALQRSACATDGEAALSSGLLFRDTADTCIWSSVHPNPEVSFTYAKPLVSTSIMSCMPSLV